MTEPTTVSLAADEAPFTAEESVPSPAANGQILIELIDDQGQAHAAELVALFGFEDQEYALICPLDQNEAPPAEDAEPTIQVLVMRAVDDGYVTIDDADEYTRVVAELERQAEEDADEMASELSDEALDALAGQGEFQADTAEQAPAA